MNQSKTKIVAATGIILTGLTVVIVLWNNTAAFSVKYFLQGMATGIITVSLLVWIAVFALNYHKHSKSSAEEQKAPPPNYIFLGAGMTSLIIGIFTVRLGGEDELLSFISTVLFVMSIIFNIIYLMNFRNRME